MKKLIITADDYGYLDHIDEGIRQAAKEGRITTVAAFANQDNEENLKSRLEKLILASPDIAIGLHLTLTSGAPISLTRESSLVYQDLSMGFHFRIVSNHVLEEIAIEEVEQEIKAQYDRFKKVMNELGKEIDSLSCHHNFLYFDQKLFQTVLNLANRENIPLRSSMRWERFYSKIFRFALFKGAMNNIGYGVVSAFRNLKPEGMARQTAQVIAREIKTSSYFSILFYGTSHRNREDISFQNLLDYDGDYGSIELILHLGVKVKKTPKYWGISSYKRWKEQEFVMENKSYTQLLNSQLFQLSTFRSL